MGGEWFREVGETDSQTVEDISSNVRNLHLDRKRKMLQCSNVQKIECGRNRFNLKEDNDHPSWL